MVMRRLFGRKKSDEEKEEETAESTEAEMTEEPPTEATEEIEAPAEAMEDAEAPAEESGEPAVERVRRAETIPYHDSLPRRLKYLLEESPIASTIEGPDEFSIELMASGERTWIKKASNGPLEYGTGAVPDEDVFIRVSDDVVSELLNAPTFEEFSRIYMQYYRNSEPGKYVKIELRKSISDLNRRGYARVPVLKLLVGAVR
ncbi:MAG: hypothetical protein K9W43_01740 [Candidatus Thorarchaeota archaeon]|nr:hypothetical protein [Candidatus Thorarchaeota archaeon]